jgi:hypothetical protein
VVSEAGVDAKMKMGFTFSSHASDYIPNEESKDNSIHLAQLNDVRSVF